MNPDARILLILDVDETLVHATPRPLERAPDFLVGPYFVYGRPHLQEFLQESAEHFRLAFWSSGSAGYVERIVQTILPADVEPVFVWNRSRCTQRLDFETREEYFLKDLKKVKRRGFDLRRVLIVEDEPRKVHRHYGNAIYVAPYFGAVEDNELERLTPYLLTLRDAPNVRALEKRDWKRRP